MKNLLPVLSLLFCSFLIAQKDFEKTELAILPGSELIINGSTNVNNFHCRFDIDLISEARKVNFTMEDSCIWVKDLVLRLDTSGFDCRNKRMNEDFQDLLMFDTYPEIHISIDKIQIISEQYARAFIKVHLAGQNNFYELPVKTERNRYEGKLKLNIRDFGLEPPKKALGLIQVDEEIEIAFNLIVSGL
ncbi:YceI family protein [Gramella sp. AN32]|uniref:YceI family protein n=1 Tax=Christiangramia antarctica TaxID=2058158 RepID=A0ABW5XAP5_9FLAO|nr:YceI family protein [Gramella sp. AN32]MCM4157338.1 hypothetical protein [Gramella sp. AN32]